MNKTYKVARSLTRGTVVTSEIASAYQGKALKTVVAVAAAFVCGVAMAATKNFTDSQTWSSGTYTIESGNAVSVKGKTFEVNGDTVVTNAGTLNGLEGATVTVSGGTVTNGETGNMNFKPANVTVSGGKVSNANSVNFTKEATLTVSGAGEFTNTGKLTGNGATMNFSGGTVTNSGEKGNFAFGDGKVTISGGTVSNAASAQMNFGSKATLTITGGELTNTGTLNGNGAAVAVSGGKITNKDNGLLNFKASSVTISDSGTISNEATGTGQMSFTSKGSLKVTEGGKLTNTGKFDGNGAAVEVSGGTITNSGENGNMSFDDAKVTISGGTVSNAASAEMSFGSQAILEISGGELTNTGTLNASGMSEDNKSTTVKVSGGKLTNKENGLLNFKDASVTISSGGTISNEATGTGQMSFTSKGSLKVTEGGKLTNTGKFDGNGASVEVSGGELINNANGLIGFDDANVKFSGGTVSNAASAEMSFGSQAILEISGGELTNTGTLNASGMSEDNKSTTVKVSGGKLTNNAEGTLNFKDANVTISGGAVSNEAGAVMYMRSKGKLTITNGELTNAGTFNALTADDGSKTTVEVSGGKLTNNAEGTLNFNESEVTIFGGTVSNEAKGTMNFRSSGTLTIKDNGNLTNAGILNGNGATMNFSGGTVTNNENASMHFKDANVTISGGKVSTAGTMSFGSQGKLTISGGELTNTGTLNGNEATVKDTGVLNITGGKATLASLAFGASGTANISGGTLDVETITVDAGRGDTKAITLSNTGVLQTTSRVLMSKGLDESGISVTATEGFNSVGNAITFNGGEVALEDTYYNISYVKSLNSFINSATETAKTVITMLGTLVKADGEVSGGTTSLSDVDNIEGVVLATEDLVADQTTGEGTKKYLVIGVASTDGITTDSTESKTDYSTAQTHSTSVGGRSLQLGNGDAVLVTGNKVLTLVGAGEGSVLVKTADSTGTETSTSVIIDVGTNSSGGTLNLGTNTATGGGTVNGDINVSQTGTLNVKNSEYTVDGTINAKGGTINVDNSATLNVTTVDLSSASTSGTETAQAALNITNNAKATVSELKGSGVIQVGEVDGQGATLSVEKLSMTGGFIFVDPAIGHSTFTVSEYGTDGLNNCVTAGNGSLVIFGATESVATNAISKIDGLDDVQALVYMASPLTLGTNGSLLINSEAAASTYASTGTVQITKGALVFDHNGIGTGPIFTDATSVTVAESATIAVVNPRIGSVLITNGTLTASESATVVTDSPFISATLNSSDKTIVLSQNSDQAGSAVIASFGVQSMIRRADMILAETIADRAAETDPGSNLWVMVRGERYEQDSLGDGAGFHANMGYGAFGAEFAPNEKTNIGLAFQYGHGTVKGDVGSAKNKTKDYSATIYGSALLGDTGIKLLGEVAYTQSSNDITNTYYTGLNQDLDAKMISGGVTLQKRFDFDSFSLTPSIGARVSKLKTDAMKLGVNKLDKQSQTIVQVPIALRLAGKTAQTESGWSITPRFKVAYIPTFGDKEIDIYGVKKTVLDTSPVQGAFGINFQKGGFSIDATANAGVGNRGTSSIGGKLEMNYRF